MTIENTPQTRIFADYAPKLYANGYSVIWAKGKRPILDNWDVFKQRRATEAEFDGWILHHPNDNIGLTMGEANGFAALDIDFGELWVFPENRPLIAEWASKIADLVPKSPFVRMGEKPWAALFRFRNQLGSKITVNGIKVGEFITNVQIILPPSIHPDTGQPYKWIGGHDLADYDLEEAHDITPEFTTDMYNKLLKEMKKFIKPQLVPNLPGRNGAKKSGKGGRNNTLQMKAMKMFDNGIQPLQVAEELIKIDLEEHDNPLFSDPKDQYAYLPTRERALRFSNSIFDYFLKARQDRQDEIPQPTTIEEHKAKVDGVVERITNHVNKYPSMQNGFYVEVEKELKSGDVKIVEYPDYQGLAFYLSEEFGLRFKAGYAHVYNGTHFVTIDDHTLRQKIDELTHRKRDANVIMAFYKSCVYKCTLPEESFIAPVGYLNCANGIVRLSDRSMTPHNKEIFFTYVLPHNFIAGVDCPKWIEFLEQTFPPKYKKDETGIEDIHKDLNQGLIDVIAEIFGYVLEGGIPWLHKAFFFYGSGRNGKGVVTDVLKALIGPKNYTSVPIQKLDKEFSAVMIDGKLANIVTELSTSAAQSDVFKTVVAGEPIPVSEKHQKQYLMTPTARVIVSANQYPKFNDATVGAVDRLCIIPFENYIPEDRRDPMLASKLLAEISGIMNWALDGLDRLKQRQHLPKVESISLQLKDYKEESDSIFAYYLSHFSIGGMRESKLTVANLYPNYVNWCQDEGRFPKPKISFSRAFAALVREDDPNHERIKETFPGNKLTLKGAFTMKDNRNEYIGLTGNSPSVYSKQG